MTEPTSQTPAEVLAAHVAGLNRGQAVDLEALCRTYPQCSVELRRLTAHWEQVQTVVDALGGGSARSLAERLRQRYGNVDPGLSIDRPPSPARPASTGSGTLERLEAHAPRATRYQTRGEIARGGMGAILEVWDEDLRRTLAMKVALTKGAEQSESGSGDGDSRLLERFLEEAQITAQLDHPGIVPVHELGLGEDGRVFFTMPLVRGRDLAGILEQVRNGQEGWTPQRAVGVLLKVCEAMAYAHSKRVIHRDLKPANIMVGRFGEVYVMDWGLAKVMGRKDSRDLRVKERVAKDVSKSLVSTDRDALEASPLMTMDGDVVGTPSYMSPEQARGDLELMGPASDVYSIGAILYHLLAGHMPYVPADSQRNAFAVWSLLQSDPPDSLRKVAPKAPEELVAICDMAMARDGEARYPDTVAMAEDLRAYSEGRVVSAHATGALTELRKWVGRNKPVAITAVAALVVVVAILFANGYRQANMEDTLTSKQDEVDALWSKVLGSQERLQAQEVNVARLFDAARAESYVANLTGAALNQEAGNYAEASRRLAACPEELRGWEWNHLRLGENPSLWAAAGGTGAAAWRDGDTLFTGSQDGYLHLREASSGLIRSSARVCAHVVTALDVRDGRGVCGGGDGTLVTWEDLPSAGHDWSSGDQAMTAVALGPGGRIFAGQGERYHQQLGGVLAAERLETNRIFVWDAQGELLMTLDGHPAPVRCLLPLTDERLMSGGADGRIVVWDLTNGERLLGWRAHSGGVNDLARVDDEKVVSVGEDAGAILWSVADGKRLALFSSSVLGDVGDSAALSCAISPDGRRGVIGSRDRTVRVLDILAGEELSVLRGHEGPVNSVAFSGDGARILSTSSTDGVRVWDAHTRSAVTGISHHDHRVSELPLRWSGGGRADAVWALEFEHKRVRRPYLLSDIAVANPIEPIVAHRGRQRRLRGEYRVDLWTLEGAQVESWPGHTDRVTTLAWDGAGRLLASGSDDRSVRLWERGREEALAVFEGLTAGVAELAWRADGAWLAVGTDDGRVILLDTSTGERRDLAGRHAGGVRALAWTSDGAWLASGAVDDVIQVWSFVQPDVEPRRLLGHQGDVTAVVFSGDGARLFSGSADKTVRVWHRISGTSMLTLRGSQYPIGGLALARDGRRLVSWGQSRYPAVRVWDSAIEDAQSMWEVRAQAQRATEVVQELSSIHGSSAAVLAALDERRDLEPAVLSIARVFANRLEQ
jgi:WD40 repeat protein/serine/threonine protein kinase